MDFTAFMAEQGVDTTASPVPAPDTDDTGLDLGGDTADFSGDPGGEAQDFGATDGDGTAPLETEAETGVAADGFTRLDPNTLPEEVKPFYRQMQADYTRKTQALAQERQAFDQDPVTQAVRTVQQLATADPVGLVQYLHQTLQGAIQNAQQLGHQVNLPGFGQESQGQEPSYEADLDESLLTDTERALYGQTKQLQQQLQQMAQRLQQYEPVVQQSQVERAKAQIDAAYTQIEKNVLKRDLTPQERDSLAQYATQMGVRNMDQFIQAAKAWDYDNAQRRGRDQASQVVQVKQNLRQPGARTVTPAAGAPAAGQNLTGRSRMEALFAEAEAGR